MENAPHGNASLREGDPGKWQWAGLSILGHQPSARDQDMHRLPQRPVRA